MAVAFKNYRAHDAHAQRDSKFSLVSRDNKYAIYSALDHCIKVAGINVR